jgi:hypothetical protein
MDRKHSSWKEFETLILKIQHQLAPDADIRHNHRVLGKDTGRRRQLDITITQNVGAYPIFIVIECKNYGKRPVGIERVEAFAKKLQDVRASLGIMVSSSGFDQGARAVGAASNIKLLAYREAQVTDWNALIDSLNWAGILVWDVSTEPHFVRLTGAEQAIKVSSDSAVFNTFGEQIATIEALESELMKELGHPPTLGEFKIYLSPVDDAWYIYLHNQLVMVERIEIEATATARKYLFNLEFATGDILEDSGNGGPFFKQVASAGIDWRSVGSNHPYVDVTNEEYQAMISQNEQGQLLIPLRSETKDFIRFVLTQKPSVS